MKKAAAYTLAKMFPESKSKAKLTFRCCFFPSTLENHRRALRTSGVARSQHVSQFCLFPGRPELDSRPCPTVSDLVQFHLLVQAARKVRDIASETSWVYSPKSSYQRHTIRWWLGEYRNLDHNHPGFYRMPSSLFHRTTSRRISVAYLGQSRAPTCL